MEKLYIPMYFLSPWDPSPSFLHWLAYSRAFKMSLWFLFLFLVLVSAFTVVPVRELSDSSYCSDLEATPRMAFPFTNRGNT